MWWENLTKKKMDVGSIRAGLVPLPLLMCKASSHQEFCSISELVDVLEQFDFIQSNRAGMRSTNSIKRGKGSGRKFQEL